MAPAVGGDSRSADDERDADASFPDGAFASIESFTASAAGPVIRGVNDIGGVGESEPIDRGDDPSYARIEILGDRGGRELFSSASSTAASAVA